MKSRKKKKKWKGGREIKPTSWVSSQQEKKEIFIICVSVLTMLPDSAGILKTYNQTKRRAQLWNPEQWIPVLCLGDELFFWVFMTGRAFPGNAPVPPPGAHCWVSAEAGGLPPVLWGGHCLFSGCLPLRGPQQASGSHQNTIRVKAGAGWRGEEDGGVPASPYLKKKYKSKQKEKIDNWYWKTKLEISGSIIIIKPVFKLPRVFEIK